MKITGNENSIYVPFLSAAAISFTAGILCGFFIALPFVMGYCLAACLILLLLCLQRRGMRTDVFILLGFFLIGMLHQRNRAALSPNDISYWTGLGRTQVSVEGVVASHVQESPYDKSFLFYPRRLLSGKHSYAVGGKLLVRFNKRVDIEYGERLTIEGILRALKDAGYFNRRLMRQNIRSVLYVRRGDWIDKEQKGMPSIQRLAFFIREKLKERFSALGSPTSDFLIAFLLGDRKGLPEEIYPAFQYTGTVHIIAISGLNIGIIIFILLVVLKIIGFRRNLRFVITMIFLLLYSLITGMQASVVRAVIMGMIFLLSYMVEREYHIYNSLALAALIILALWPWQVFDIGFQLSFTSVISIVCLYPKIMASLTSVWQARLPKLKNRFASFALASFVVSLSASIGVAPMVAYYFGIVSIVSLLANVVVVAFMPPIIAGGFLYLLLSYCLPVFAGWVACALEAVICGLLWTTIFFKQVPYAYFFVEPFGVYILFVYYGALLLWLNRRRIRFR